MKIKERVQAIIQKLEEAYPNAHCELEFETAFQLLVATILSAQCTDKRVNIVTRVLFQKCRTPQDFAEISQNELDQSGNLILVEVREAGHSAFPALDNREDLRRS